MADPRDHDAPIWAITMGGIRSAPRKRSDHTRDPPSIPSRNRSE
jgi:hypothetical protein